MVDSLVHQILFSAFNVSNAQLRRLAGEVDLNFSVEFGAGEKRVLKLYGPNVSTPDLEMQDTALAHLASVAPELGAPILHGTSKVDVDGQQRVVRLLGWVEGTVWGNTTGRLAQLRSLGQVVAKTDRALVGFDHDGLDRPHRWLMNSASELETPQDPWAISTLARFRSTVLPKVRALPQQAIHNDASENNILLDRPDGVVRGLIDFGDMVRSPRVVGLAVAVAYAMFGQVDPLTAACAVVGGYHHEVPLEPAELSILHDLVCTRLAMSVANAEAQIRLAPDNAEYLSTSQLAIQKLIRTLSFVEFGLAHASYRNACGYLPVDSERAVQRYFSSASFQPAPVVTVLLATLPVLDWSGNATGTELPADGFAIGRYREDRTVYDTDAFATPFGERRTMHLGVDIFVPAGTPVFAPLDGVVHTSEIRNDRGDYGGVALLEHRTSDGVPFWFLMGHLSHACIAMLAPGRAVVQGEQIANVGEKHENGGWVPHVHAQLYTDLLGRSTDLPGVVRKSQLDVWESISPNPAPMLAGLSRRGVAAPRVRARADLLQRRTVNLSTSLSVSYSEPLHIVAGDGASLIDHTGRRWLDLVNNVAHVGHEHPQVVRALTEQASRLNTNTRYLHPNIVEFAERLRALFPDPLSVVFVTNSGSEANDLALRLAQTATNRSGTITMDWGYHGNLTSLIEVSPYKFNRTGGKGVSDRVRIAELPDPYRGAFGNEGAAYASSVASGAHSLRMAGFGAAAFLHESVSGCGGQVELASGYLSAAYDAARSAGALCIADEVQCGLGRVGSHWSAFETHGVVPDIVTLGKPIGNGHPLGAVITTPEIARRFRTGMEYFNTFAGNPVSCAVGLAVLDVLDNERLVAHADTVGTSFREGLVGLMDRHELIGDVRGRGLFLGVDLVADRDTKEPATSLCHEVVEAMKQRGVLISSDGPHDNVLKIKPPMVLSASEVNRVLGALDDALTVVRSEH